MSRPSIFLAAFACVVSSTGLDVAIAGSAPHVTASSVPSPYYSAIPNRLHACPVRYVLTLMKVGNTDGSAAAGATVVIDFSRCPTFTVCPVESTDTYTYDAASRTVSIVADSSGVVRLLLRGGGVCVTSRSVMIFADGVLLAYATMASPDQNGDLLVDDADVAIVQSKIGTNDWTAIFDNGLIVTQADLDFVTQHLSHDCGSTPIHERTWGSLKVLYR